MHPEYLPTTTDGKLTHVMEESAEVIKLICKSQRFGIDSVHPVHGYVTRTKLLAEMDDLRQAIKALERALT